MITLKSEEKIDKNLKVFIEKYFLIFGVILILEKIYNQIKTIYMCLPVFVKNKIFDFLKIYFDQQSML